MKEGRHMLSKLINLIYKIFTIFGTIYLILCLSGYLHPNRIFTLILLLFLIIQIILLEIRRESESKNI
jgi:hypothetical protein